MRIKNIIVVAIVSLVLAAPAAIAQFSKTTVSSQISSQFPDQTTGQITPATTRAFLNNLLNSYQQFAGLNKQAGTTYTVALSDYGQLLQFSGGTVAVAISPASTLTTFNFYAQNLSTGNVVIAPSAGTICGASTMTLQNTQSVWVISDGTNYQCMFGLAGTQLTTPLTVSNGGTGGSSASGTLIDNISGFSSTGFLLRSGAGSYTFLPQLGGLTLGNISTLNANTTICNPSNSNQQPLACTPGQMSLVLCTPTRLNFTTATNTTLTTPTCNGALPTQLEIVLVGGGGGGSGSGTGPSASGNGTASCWNTSGAACTSPSFQAGGGTAGSTSGAATSTAAGGAASGCDIGIAGGLGGPSTNVANQSGGMGGNSYFGGGGPSGAAGNNAGAAAVNSGGGGGGAGAQATANTGGGGGAGAYCLKTLTPANVLSSYVVTVGTGGKAGGAGVSGTAGGAGGDGFISVKAKWQ